MPPIRKSTRSAPDKTGQRALRIIALLFFVAIFGLSGLQLSRPNTTPGSTDVAATPLPGSPTAITFPPVPAGGTVLTADYTYVHPSAIFSITHLQGWDLPAQAGEERTDPTSSATRLSRAGATFINGAAYSVLHLFAENDPQRAAQTLDQLDKYYDKANLDAAWQNFSGGYKELDRKTDGDKFIIDFDLYLNGNTYLARQISHFDHGWLLVSRLVAPDNNAQLLDQLQTVTWNTFTLYPNETTTPITWSAVADTAMGYVLKYPASWNQSSGAPGLPYLITGTLNTVTVTLTTGAVSGKAVKSEAEVRAWVAALNPKNTVQTVAPTTSGDASGFNVSFSDPDPDGNPRSAISLLINGVNGTLYTATYITTLRNLDLLNSADTSIPPELAQSRGSLLLLPVAKLVPTLTPTMTPTPLPVTPSPVPPTVAASATPIPATSAPATPTSAATKASEF